jgi:hypothetical protein
MLDAIRRDFPERRAFLAHRRGPSFRHLSVEVVRRDAALKTLCFFGLAATGPLTKSN